MHLDWLTSPNGQYAYQLIDLKIHQQILQVSWLGIPNDGMYRWWLTNRPNKRSASSVISSTFVEIFIHLSSIQTTLHRDLLFDAHNLYGKSEAKSLFGRQEFLLSGFL